MVPFITIIIMFEDNLQSCESMTNLLTNLHVTQIYLLIPIEMKMYFYYFL